MALSDVGFVIRPRVDTSQSKKPLEEGAKAIREQEKAVERLDKRWKPTGERMERTWKTVKVVATDASRAIETSITRSVGAVDRLNAAIDKTKDRLLNVRTLFTTGILGAATFGGLSKLLSAGRANLAAEGKIRRQFGSEAELVRRAANGMAQAGLGDDESINALIPIMQAVQETRAGTRYRGKRLTESQAARLREQTFGVGAGLFKRLVTLAPDMDPQTLGLMLAEAGTGPESTVRLARALGLNRALTRRVVAANAKGKLSEMLSPAEMAKFGIERGKQAGQGTVLDVLLSKAGLTEEAATAARSKFPAQMKTIGALFENTLGDIGAKAMDKLNKGLAQGGNLAEKLQKYLESDEGRKTIDKIAEAVSKVVGGVADLAKKIPEIITFVESHKDGLLAAGIGLLGVRAFGEVRPLLGDLAGGAKAILSRFGGGLGKAAAGAADKAGDASAVRVHVTNWPPGFGGGGGGGVPKALAGAGATAGALDAGIAAAGALGMAGSLLSLGYATEGVNANKYQVQGETEQILNTARMGRVGAIVRAFERAGGTEASPADVMRELGATAGYVSQDKGLQAVVQGLVNQNVDESIPADLRKELITQLRGSPQLLGEGAIQINVGGVHGVLTPQTIPGIVEQLMPQVKEQLTRELSNATGGGAAPAGG